MKFNVCDHLRLKEGNAISPKHAGLTGTYVDNNEPSTYRCARMSFDSPCPWDIHGTGSPVLFCDPKELHRYFELAEPRPDPTEGFFT